MIHREQPRTSVGSVSKHPQIHCLGPRMNKWSVLEVVVRRGRGHEGVVVRRGMVTRNGHRVEQCSAGDMVTKGLCLICIQEEESPCGEVTLKRDRSFSEHDLAQLRSEVVSGLQSVSQPPGGSEPPRARAGSMHSWRPSARDQGKYCLSQHLLFSHPSHALCGAASGSHAL